MANCCVDLAKFLVFVVNFAAWVCGLVVLGGIIYVFVNSEKVLGVRITPDLSPDNKTAIYFSLFLILIVVFVFLVFFTFLGCCGAAFQSRCMIGSFIIILFVFLGGYIGGIIYMFMAFNSVSDMVSEELVKSIRYYDVTEEVSIVRKSWDFVQPKLGCCGVSDWTDWETCEGLLPGRKVPKSCCSYDGRRPPSESDSSEGDCVYSPSSDNTYPAGCLDIARPYIITIFWSIPALMLVILILSLVVCFQSGRRRHWRRRRRGQGFISTAITTDGGGKRYDSGPDEGTGYVYRGSGSPPYNPPYNPAYPSYTGVAVPHRLPEYREPLLMATRPPPPQPAPGVPRRGGRPQPPPYVAADDYNR